MTDKVVPLPGAVDTGLVQKRASRGRRKYTDDQRAVALAVYKEHGPTYAQAETGIDKTTIVGWAKEAGVQTIRSEKTFAAAEAWKAKSLELRERARYLMHEGAVRSLERMHEPYVDFKGQMGTKRIYEEPPADAQRNFAMTAAILIDKIRLEEGSSTSNVAVNLRAMVQRAAAESGFSEEDIMEEAKQLLDGRQSDA